MIKIFGIVFISLILILILKVFKSSFSSVITISVSVLLLGASLVHINEILVKVKDISNQISETNSFVILMVKLLGITLATQFITSLCKDLGESAISSQLELYSKVFMLIVSLPLFESVINIISDLVK